MKNYIIVSPFRLGILLAFMAGALACRPTASSTEVSEQEEQASPYYAEQHRPQFHFSPDSMWMNDPNGMVYFDGEYHLFYQYYPDSTVWGPMHWGHAVSPDLVHWEHLPAALYPDSLGYIFSGSAVIDWNNTSGFGKDGQPPMVAIFTYHNMEYQRAGRNDVESQGIAYSNDRGRTWTKYAGNPVVPNSEMIRDFRDPKVFWDDDAQQWILILAAQDRVKIFGSQDLKTWTHLSDFGQAWGSHGGVWECPDLFLLETEDGGEKKWVMLVSINPGSVNGGSGTQYFIGDFDGEQFKLDENFASYVTAEKALWIDYGHDNYAGVTWSDIPARDGRRLFLGWMSNWSYAQVVPTQNWRSAMTVSREIRLNNTPEGYRLSFQPVQELQRLRQDSFHLKQVSFTESLPLTDSLGFDPALSEIILEFDLSTTTATTFGLRVSNDLNEYYQIGFDGESQEFFSDRSAAGKTDFSDKFAPKEYTIPRKTEGDLLRLHLFLDKSSVEIFADDGATVISEIFFPNQEFDQLSLYAAGGTVAVEGICIYELKGIWD